MQQQTQNAALLKLHLTQFFKATFSTVLAIFILEASLFVRPFASFFKTWTKLELALLVVLLFFAYLFRKKPFAILGIVVGGFLGSLFLYGIFGFFYVEICGIAPCF